jgi:hypothetical protein
LINLLKSIIAHAIKNKKSTETIKPIDPKIATLPVKIFVSTAAPHLACFSLRNKYHDFRLNVIIPGVIFAGY